MYAGVVVVVDGVGAGCVVVDAGFDVGLVVVVDGTKTWILNRCAMMLVGNLIAP